MMLNLIQMQELLQAIQELGATAIEIDDDAGRISYYVPNRGWLDGKGNPLH